MKLDDSIDEIWAKVYHQFEFYMFNVQACILAAFFDQLMSLSCYCYVLRYMSICNRSHPEHIHFILAVSPQHKYQVFGALRPDKFCCPIMQRLDEFNTTLFKQQYYRNFSWPEHVHVKYTHLKSAAELFDSIAYISTHDAPRNDNFEVHIQPALNIEDSCAVFHFLIPKSNDIREDPKIILELKEFIASYQHRRNEHGTNMHIFRPTIKYAAIYLSLVYERGFFGYIEEKLHSLSISPFLDKVTVIDGRPNLAFQFLTPTLPDFPLNIPLPCDCSQLKQPEKFICLSQQIHLQTVKSDCDHRWNFHHVLQSLNSCTYFLSPEQQCVYNSYLYSTTMDKFEKETLLQTINRLREEKSTIEREKFEQEIKLVALTGENENLKLRNNLLYAYLSTFDVNPKLIADLDNKNV